MATRKRGPRHPGVVLIRPDAARRTGWRARFRDPDMDKLVKVSLDSSLTTLEQREHWAVQKSRTLAKRRVELEGGAVRASGTAFGEVIGRYFKAHGQLRPKTLVAYRAACDRLITWAARSGVHSADDLTRPKLLGFRETLIAEPKRAPGLGRGQRGKWHAGADPRSPETVNSELRRLRTVLGYLRDLDLFAHLSHDDLRRALKHLPTTRERVEYLKPHELQKLLEAALRHDAATFDATRDEHAGNAAPGSTPRYDPIAPFVALVLLTGMRFGEALAVDWQQVDLDALDHEGHAVGEIHLSGASTKTHHARTVGLDVSPALRKVLAALRVRTGGQGPVFQLRKRDDDGKPIALSRGTADAAGKRLIGEYGAPKAFGWQMLRRTCGTFLTNAPGIFGASSAYRSAKQLGHSVTVAERHYLDVARGIPKDAHTLEAAMQIEGELARIVQGIGGKAGRFASVAGRATR